jgi:hypothetical protein
VRAAPPPQTQVLHSTHIPIGDPRGITNHQGPNPVLHNEGDHLLGGLVLGLLDAAAMVDLGTTQAGSMTAPTP